MFIIENWEIQKTTKKITSGSTPRKKKSTVLLYFLPDFPGAVLRS